MQLRKENGISLLTLLLVIAAIVAGAVWWKHSQDTKRKEQTLKGQARIATEQALNEKQRELEEQKKAFEIQLQKEHGKKEVEKSISSLATIYLRWNDALKLVRKVYAQFPAERAACQPFDPGRRVNDLHQRRHQ